MKKIVSFAGFDTLFDIDPFYDAIGRLGKRYNIDEKLIRDTYQAKERELMQQVPFEKYSKLMEDALNQTAKELNFEITPSDFSDVLIAHTVVKPFPDAPTALYQIQEKGYETVLMTNHSKDLIRSNMINLDHNFNAVFTAEDAKSYKPSPEFFNFVNEQLGEVDEHIHIAVDMDKDIVPAQKAGWRVIPIDRKNESASIASLMDTIDNL
ncbi:HAD hydrolase-like protein [Pediococcus stilesii]|uniref:HAD superfamily hydrolase n=1 Tax=Pediococcus stilesii TaxID=331679 RepID=A0A0R2L4L1_9LACO|nr:HAD hydrolase-like protein [Pediococcus stilesii]KRN93687.1 HAD superfamily hydrolase [Pediococcus stilesii]